MWTQKICCFENLSGRSMLQFLIRPAATRDMHIESLIMVSMILQHVDVREIGRKLFGDEESPF